MDPIASFQGLATGINFRDLIDQIIIAESRPITLNRTKISDLQRRASALEEVRDLIDSLESAAGELGRGDAFDAFVTRLTGGTEGAFTATTSTKAAPGTHTVEVLQLATAERLAGSTFSSESDALALSGEFFVGGKRVEIDAADSLDKIADRINAVNGGADASGVTATVLSTADSEHRLILAAETTGEAGIDLVDGASGLLRSLGVLENSTEVKEYTSDGAKSDGFLSSATVLSTLLGLTTPPASGAVTIGALSVTLDLSTMSLDDVATAINAEAALQSSPITAAVVDEADEDGSTSKRLDISGTTSFTDANRILETLGVLEGKRGDETQVVQSGSAFTDGDAVTVATASTTLANLFVGGSSASVQVGDTLTLNGTEGDGTTFTKTYTVGVSDTLQSLLDSLNAADAFGGGTATATASIAADGRLIVTDDTGGESQLDLGIVSHNESGGRLDFGASTVLTKGRDRVLVAGTDAQVKIDGSFITDTDNTVMDVLEGVTLELEKVGTGATTLRIDRDTESIVGDVRAFIDAFNAIVDYANNQFSGLGAEEGEIVPPLSGSSALRGIVSGLRTQMNASLGGAVSGTLRRLADVGIEINRDGRYDFDEAAFNGLIDTEFANVRGLFVAVGLADTTALEYVSAGSDTEPGTYEVVITQAPTKGGTTGVGFGGAYLDDATADTLTIKDIGTQADFSISLSNGDTLAQIVDRLNAEFATAKTHRLESSVTFYADAIGTVATDDTVLSDLHDVGGANLGIAASDLITVSGTDSDGASVFQQISITDPSAQTLGDLRGLIAGTINSDTTVQNESGRLTFTATASGANPLALAISSNNAGGGTLSFGTIDVTTQGRNKVDILASDSGGQLKVEHEAYGAAEGVEVSLTAGGADGTASLGLTAGSYSGLDVAGTIGGTAATGLGTVLTGGDATVVDGLAIRYSGTGTGTIGDLTFSRGIASLVEVFAEPYLSSDTGSIDSIVDGLDTQVETLESRIDQIEGRLERRRDRLIRQFSALEQAMAEAQAQSQWFLAQLGSLPSASAGG